MMAVKKATKMLRHLLPSIKLGPPAFAVQVVWLLAVSIGLAYVALSPIAFLPGVGLQAYTALYVTAAGLALVPMLAIAAGAWILYTYLYSVAVPIVRSMERGRSLAHLAITVTGETFLRTLIRLAQAWAHMVGVFSREPLAFLRPTLLLSLTRQHLPVHLATGWAAGTHPQVLYATATR